MWLFVDWIRNIFLHNQDSERLTIIFQCLYGLYKFNYQKFTMQQISDYPYQSTLSLSEIRHGDVK